MLGSEFHSGKENDNRELTGRRLQEVFGGNAVSDEYHIGRHVANLFVTQTYEGQSDIHSKANCFTRALFAVLTVSRSYYWSGHHRHSGFCVMRGLEH
jgi:hypothetical protein